MVNEKLSYDEMVLHGYKLHIYTDKVRIFKSKGMSYEDFRPVSERLIRYLMDELFIPSQRKIRVEMVSV
jgi:hypothetical protein